MVKHINITDDIKNKIIDFTHGDYKYWKNKFKDVINELKDTKTCLYCKCRFNEVCLLENYMNPRCNEELCDVCDDEWGFGQHFWEKYGGRFDFDGIVLKYLKIQQVLDDNNID